MSVYTSASHTQIESLISAYGLGTLYEFSGISAGIENTNYLLNTQQGDFILTLYEHFSVNEVRLFLDLLNKLSELDNYYPCPLLNFQQQYSQIFVARPSAIFKCLSGKSVMHATLKQCQSVAVALAKFHISGSSIEFNKQNPRNFTWIEEAVEQVNVHLSVQDALLLKDELQYQQQFSTQHLSTGMIHADLFKDNVLFIGERLTGMLDFYAACHDYYLLDVAITLNDWCVDMQGQFNRKQYNVFMQAYKKVRAIPQHEEIWLPLFLRRACLRFWLSRLEHKIQPREGEITQEKDPENFKNLLLQHRQFYA